MHTTGADTGRQGARATSSQELPQTVTVQDMARCLKVSERTIERRIDRGELPAFKVGHRSVRVFHDDFLRYLARLPDRHAKGVA